jgi:hypothetical protein
VSDGGTWKFKFQNYLPPPDDGRGENSTAMQKMEKGMMFIITFSVSRWLPPFPHRGKGIFTAASPQHCFGLAK